MKRSQVEEGNCGHWEYEVQHPIAPPEAGALEQSSLPRNFGTNTRRLRFSRVASREYSVEMALEGMSSRVHETQSTIQNLRTAGLALALTEQGLDRRTPTPLIELGMSEDLNDGSAMSSDNGVWDSPQSTAHSALNAGIESPLFEIFEDQNPGAPASAHSLVNEFSQTISPDLLREITSGADTDELQQGHGDADHGQENQDPLGNWDVTPRRSPLPEWFPRIPLQDITNVLASNLDDEQPQPKKKRNKRVGSALAPSLLTISGASAKTKDSTIAQPRSSTSAASNLRKNFR